MKGWLRQVAATLAFLLAWITGRKYDTLARRMGRPPDTPYTERRRFIVIQIDGLAHEYLLQVVAAGHMPTLQRLIATGYHLQRWRCGLPSTTPAIQAGLMYGDNWNIPAFRWYEKDTGTAPQCKSPPMVARLKERVAAGRPGILAGGSSYTNMFDGDARLALFTVSAMGRQRFFEHLRGLGWALLFALIPWRILRILALSAWELLRDVARTVGLWVRGGFRKRLRLDKPVLQVLTNVVFGEIQTFGVVLDVYRGMPAILANYYGYDEVAHSDGPLGREALRALRRIDSYIRQIERARRKHWPDTELYICSDHGMSPAVPFETVDEKIPLGQFVAEHVRASVVWDEGLGVAGWGNPSVAPTQADRWLPSGSLWLLDELDGIESHLSGRGRRLAQALRRRLRERVPPDPTLGWDLARGSDVVVRSSGSLAHLYFNVTTERMNVSEIAILYPDLVDALIRHPGIGLVLGTERGHPVIVTSRGTVALAAERLPADLGDRELAGADLERLLSFPHSGDLVLLGAWIAQGRRVVTFEDHAATHGGLGGPQDYPFFLSPADAPLDLAGVTNAQQLYPYFIERFQR